MRRVLVGSLVAFVAATAALAVTASPPEASVGLDTLAAPSAAAQSGLQGACAGTAPPCGYITPIIDLQFPEKVKCSGAPGNIDLDKCAPIPGDGQSLELSGKVKWYWKLSEDLTYPPDPAQPITLSFKSTASNPSYLKFKMEPSEFTIDAVALFSPDNMEVDQSNPTAPVVYYVFDPEVKVTITREGMPQAGKEADRLASRDGLASVFVKAHSTPSGSYYKEAFGVEEFRFDARGLLPSPGTEVITEEKVVDGVTTTVTRTVTVTRSAPGATALLLLVGALGLAASRRNT